MKRIMKHTLAVLASLQVFAANAQGQSMLDGNPVWMYKQFVGVEYGRYTTLGDYIYHVYYLNGDTLIDGKLYHKMYYDRICDDIYVGRSIKGELIAAVREEGGRLLSPRSMYTKMWGDMEWYYEAFDHTTDEVILYDFNALATQSSMPVVRDGISEAWQVASAGDVTMEDGSTSQSYTATDTDGNSSTIIEGIGITNGSVSWFAPFANDAFLLPDSLELPDKPTYPTYSDSPTKHLSQRKGVIVHFIDTDQSKLIMFIKNNTIAYNPDNIKSLMFLGDYMNIEISSGENGLVDLGLSVKWATCNLGASSPTDRGLYYFWGDTVGIDINNMEEYSSEYYNYKDNLVSGISRTKYDAAYHHDSSLRLPTAEEVKELLDNCDMFQTSINGTVGWIVTGPNGNTLFLPGCGFIRDVLSGKLLHDGANDAYYMVDDKYVRLYNDGYYKESQSQYTFLSIYGDTRGGQIRAVENTLGEKWLSTEEYLHYNDEYKIWGNGGVVNPTAEAWEELFAKYSQLLVRSSDDQGRMQQLMFSNFNRYVERKGIEFFAQYACKAYLGSDNKIIYFIDHIDDDFIDFIREDADPYTLSDLVNVDIDYNGNPLYTKQCEWTMEPCADSLGLPDNTYLYATPSTTSAQPYIAFNMPKTLLTGYNHTLRITMAPETHDDVTPQPNQFRVNIYFTDKNGSWPINRSMTLRNPVDNAPNFVSSATEVTVFDIPIDVNNMTDIMVQIQSYVSKAQTKTYSRSLRIANVEIISTPINVDYASLADMTQVGEEVISGLCDYTDGMQVKLDMQRIGHLFGDDFDTESLKPYAMSSTSTSTLMSRNADDASHDFTLDMECVVNNRHTVNTDIFAVDYAVTDGTLSITADEQTCHPGVRSAGSLFLVDESSQRYYELVLDVQFAQKQTLLASFDVVKTIKLNVELMTTNSYYTHYDASKKFYSLVVSDIDLDLVTETLGTSNPMLYAEQKTDGPSMLTCDYTAAPAQGFWFKAGDDGVSYVNPFDNTCCVGMYFIDGQLRWYEIPRRPQPGDTYTLNLYLTNPQSSKAVKYVVTITYCDKFSGNVASHAVRRLPVGMTAGDDASAIENLTPTLSEGEGVVYNLSGQRLSAPQRGLNIVGGKKVLVW